MSKDQIIIFLIVVIVWLWAAGGIHAVKCMRHFQGYKPDLKSDFIYILLFPFIVFYAMMKEDQARKINQNKKGDET